jgi:hypothetical protein
LPTTIQWPPKPEFAKPLKQPERSFVSGTDANFDWLIDVVMSTVHPTMWQNVGGPGTTEPYMVNGEEVLVISQTYPVHRAIQRLFSDLRAVRPVEAKEVGAK